jgi:uncharacterized protein GlcG (DUF336 family)
LARINEEISARVDDEGKVCTVIRRDGAAIASIGNVSA